MDHEKNWWRINVLAALLLIAVAVLVGFFKQPRPIGELPEDGARRIETSTMAPGAHLLKRSDGVWTSFSYRRAWELECTQSWPEYKVWLQGSLGGSFHVVPQGQDEGRFLEGRSDAGDWVDVELERLAAGPPLHVRVTYTSRAH